MEKSSLVHVTGGSAQPRETTGYHIRLAEGKQKAGELWAPPTGANKRENKNNLRPNTRGTTSTSQ